MRVAIPLWQGRVSPVFDEARRLLLVDVFEKQEQSRHQESLIAQNPFERARMLPKLGVDLLICGRISQAQQVILACAGIRIILHICGPMEDVLFALLNDRIESGALLMPGCKGRKRQRALTDEGDMIFSITRSKMSGLMASFSKSGLSSYRDHNLAMLPDFERPPFYIELFKSWGLE